MANSKTDKPQSLLSPVPFFVTKQSYKDVAHDFHKFHRHDFNVFLHFWTTSLGVYGSMQLVNVLLQSQSLSHHLPDLFFYGNAIPVYLYIALVAISTPPKTAVLHTLLCAALLQIPFSFIVDFINNNSTLLSNLHFTAQPYQVALACISIGYGLQDLAHYLCNEPTYMGSYMQNGQYYMLILHSFWLLPLVIDAVVCERACFFPNLLVSRNRCVTCDSVSSRQAVLDLRQWIHKNIPSVPETTHVWPHKQDETDKATTMLENDAAILAAFRTIFPKHHYDIKTVQEMNEIYVTAVGSKSSINSDAVFYTPHTDGPYWFLPGASLYRVLVGLTPNELVRTRFNLQHDSQDQILTLHTMVGFDYNRELHWIDHVPGVTKNQERRSVLKLHFIVYPQGWHRYGQLCANLNTAYNTWARGNFLKTLRPSSMYENAMAWWIWLTTWSNAAFHMHFGWENLVYIATAFALGPTAFFVLTSFRHYLVYITTFASRKPTVAHGYLMRDAKLYKTLSMIQLCRHVVLPVMTGQNGDKPSKTNVIATAAVASLGFILTLIATARLGMVRTYFGTELGLVPPKWIDGFPYGTIPHPMIMGQVFGFGVILASWYQYMSNTQIAIMIAHIGFYCTHMIQEMLTSSY